MILDTRVPCRRPALLSVTCCWAATTLAALAGAPLPPEEAKAPLLPIAAASGSAEQLNPPPLTPALTEPDKTPPAAPPSRQSLTVSLINRLVERKVLTPEDAADLIKVAEADAAAVRAEAAQQQQAIVQAAAAQIAAQYAAAAPSAPPTPELMPDPNDIRVTYIPEAVKMQITDQVKDQVMQEARNEHWAAPNLLPEWVSRIKLFGDVRVRYEGDMFPSGNDNTGAFPNFNSINTGAPFDTAGTVFSPQYNVDQDRNRFRIRVRLGVDADLGDGFSAGVRLATGENDSPVTENQSLGVANGGQGGNFSKYSIWLDRGFIKWDVGGQPNKDFSITIGRFDNPFFATNVLWANDIGFDGVAIQGKYEIFKGVTPFLTVGAFPVFNTDFNFANNQPAKFSSEDKYLYAGQLGTSVRLGKDLSLKVAGAYYYYQNIEGRLSDPFTPLTTSDSGNTDDTRPAFAQNGNTYMALRNIVPNALNDFGTIDQFQYYGLATPFHDLAFTGRLDFNHFEPFQISLIGEFVQNLAFSRSKISSVAVNNLGPSPTVGVPGTFAGGNTAWIVALKLGNATLEKRWDWDFNLSYRYLESDSVVDGFNDSDFGAPLTGTNLKGFTIGADLALNPRVWLGIRWMSADSIAGPAFKSDLIQVDVNGKF